jgi:hypothetical protein
MAENTRQTGPRAASAAGKTLGSSGATKAEKSAAASARADPDSGSDRPAGRVSGRQDAGVVERDEGAEVGSGQRAQSDAEPQKPVRPKPSRGNSVRQPRGPVTPGLTAVHGFPDETRSTRARCGATATRPSQEVPRSS